MLLVCKLATSGTCDLLKKDVWSGWHEIKLVKADGGYNVYVDGIAMTSGSDNILIAGIGSIRFDGTAGRTVYATSLIGKLTSEPTA